MKILSEHSLICFSNDMKVIRQQLHDRELQFIMVSGSIKWSLWYVITGIPVNVHDYTQTCRWKRCVTGSSVESFIQAMRLNGLIVYQANEDYTICQYTAHHVNCMQDWLDSCIKFCPRHKILISTRAVNQYYPRDPMLFLQKGIKLDWITKVGDKREASHSAIKDWGQKGGV